MKCGRFPYLCHWFFYTHKRLCFTGPVAKSARFLLSLWRNHLHNNFFIKNRPATLGNAAGFFVPSRIWAFLGDFRAFRRLDGTSYRPGRKSVLNRKFAENNFFWPEIAK